MNWDDSNTVETSIEIKSGCEWDADDNACVTELGNDTESRRLVQS